MVVAGRVAHLERDLYSWMEVLDGRALEVRAGEKDQAIDPHLESIWSEIDGPAIVVEDDATTLIPPDWTARVEKYGNMTMEVA